MLCYTVNKVVFEFEFVIATGVEMYNLVAYQGMVCPVLLVISQCQIRV